MSTRMPTLARETAPWPRRGSSDSARLMSFDDRPDVMYIPSNNPLDRHVPHLPNVELPGRGGPDPA